MREYEKSDGKKNSFLFLKLQKMNSIMGFSDFF